MTALASTADDKLHKFNNDLLTEEVDQNKVRQEYPLVAETFIDAGLIERFVPVDELANLSKKRSRRSGRLAVALGVVSLMGLSASPLYHEADLPWRTMFDGIAATLGVASVLIGFFGILHSRAKKKWLASRWQTERIRQFHFQYNITNLFEVISATSDPGAIRELHQHRAEALMEVVPSDETEVSERLNKTLLIEGGEKIWLVGEPAPQLSELNPRALEDFFKAYRDLRIGHQVSYAKHVLGRKSGPLRMTIDRQQHWIERVAIGCVLLLFGLHLGVVCGGLVSWPTWIQEFSLSAWTHAISIWIAVLALGARVLGDGYGLRVDLARYSDYLFKLERIAKAYDLDDSLAGRLALMRHTEELAFAEMASFLRSANEAEYVI